MMDIIWSVNQFLYKHLSSRPVAHWYVMSLFLLSLTFSLWYLSLYRHVTSKINHYAHENLLYTKTSCDCCNYATTCSHLAIGLQAMNHDLEVMKNRTSDKNVALTSIIKKAIDANLELESCTLQKGINKDWYSVTPYVTNVHGQISSIATWLQAIIQDVPLCTIEELSLDFDTTTSFRCACTLFVAQLTKSPSTLES